MHFLYFLGSGSRWSDNEIRYSLRSLSRFKGPKEVTIIGQKPDWIKGVQFIPFRETPGMPGTMNTNRKLLEASLRLPETFTVMNDDFYFLQDRVDIPIIHSGPFEAKLKKILDSGKANMYHKGAALTLAHLKTVGITGPVGYELHLPFLVQKSKVLELNDRFNLVDQGFRTLYGNYFKIGGTPGRDVKSANPPSPAAQFFSSANKVTQAVQNYMARKFPEPSRFEI